jgi:hypothetical protein
MVAELPPYVPGYSRRHVEPRLPERHGTVIIGEAWTSSA